jgi:hypothetical protein
MCQKNRAAVYVPALSRLTVTEICSLSADADGLDAGIEMHFPEAFMILRK